MIKAGLVLSAPPQIGGGNVYETEMMALLTEMAPDGWSLIPIAKSAGGYSEILAPEDGKQRPRRSVFQKISSRRSWMTNGESLQKLTKKLSLDYIFFLSPVYSMAELLPVPTVGTVWDLGPFDLKTLPEFSGSHAQRMREVIEESFSVNLRTMVPSWKFGEELRRRFLIDGSRIVATGLPLPDLRAAPNNAVAAGGPYCVYPAKFWKHKNHETLFRAFASPEIRESGIRLVLTGISDQDRRRVISEISRFGVQEQTTVLGFLPYTVVQKVIKESAALLMPSLLGPVNYPPLEALAHGRNVVLSDCHDFDFELPSHAVSIAPKDHDVWVEEILRAAKVSHNKPYLSPMEDYRNAILETFSSLS